MILDQRKMPFVCPSSNSMLVEKACGQFASFSFVTNTMRPLMNRNAYENTKHVGVLIKRQQTPFVSKPIWQSPRSNMQSSLQVLDNFHLNHKVRLKNPFRVWTLYVFALEAVFFLFFQPQSRFRHSFKPGASFVLKIGHCFLRYNVPKLIGIAVFDHETVSHSFFDSANHLWSQIVVYIFEKTPFRDSSSPFHFILPLKFRIRLF